MRRALVVGSGGREHALARRLAESGEVCAFAGHRNPGLDALSEGRLRVGDVRDGDAVAGFAVESAVDLAVVSADDPLAAGVVDALRAAGMRTVGPDRNGAQIEWDKVAARRLVDEIAPELNPAHRIVRSPDEVDGALDELGDRPVVVKPAGLTGGKGVKVMGPHLATRDDAKSYALELLEHGPEPRMVVLEERVDAIEFTIQAFSDGRSCVFPPATFDYPYRYDGDRGDGTGGMGCYTAGAGPLPFQSEASYRQACEFIAEAVERWDRPGRSFSGVMNTGFFLADDGLKLIEFNARFGDPEAMNVLALLRTDAWDVMDAIADGRLAEVQVEFDDTASIVVYLVGPEYPRRGEPREFDLDVAAVERAGCSVNFGSCERVGENRYRTLGSSRILALSTTAPTLAEAHARVGAAIEESLGDSGLEWRRDIGNPAYVERQVSAAGVQAPAPTGRT
ncbi:MAG TPA: phosphoribosylamine--glycine ligase [Actinomycetota bacterium]|nr:phosphoribosylamine--glycine ligase [Actinomycetota bacterium]